MKVIFLEDVPPNGRAGDVKEIKDGYGRNYLLPRGLAVLATKDALERSSALTAAAEERRRKESMDWRQVAESITETPLVVEMRAGPTGRLYGSVTPAQIAEKLSEITGRTVDRRGVRIPEPIRQVGTFAVSVRLFEDISADLRVVVQSDSEHDGEAGSAETEAEPDAADEPTGDGSGERG